MLWVRIEYIYVVLTNVLMLVWFKHLCIAALNKYTQSAYQSHILPFTWFKAYTNVWLMHYNEYLFVLVLLCLWSKLVILIILMVYWHLLLVHTTPLKILDLLLVITTKCTCLHWHIYDTIVYTVVHYLHMIDATINTERNVRIEYIQATLGLLLS